MPEATSQTEAKAQAPKTAKGTTPNGTKVEGPAAAVAKMTKK